MRQSRAAFVSELPYPAAPQPLNGDFFGRQLQYAIPDYPKAVRGIRVEQRWRQLHFLHASGWSAPRGAHIGTYRIHFANATQQNMRILFGEHLLDWIGKNALAPNDHSIEAWNHDRDESVTERLFMTTWTNPTPEIEVETIDFLSEMTDAAPFLIAVTADL